MNSPDRALIAASDQVLTDMIRAARRRLIFMAPGMSRRVAVEIGLRIRELGPANITVIVDVDAEVFRLGYGDFVGLAALEGAGRKLGLMVHRQPAVRIGLLIADDETLVFAPTPLLVEAGPGTAAPGGPVKPNAIRLGIPPAGVERDLGQGPDGVREQTIGLDKAETRAIQAVRQDLERNPPQRFDLARRLRGFNSCIEFVDLELRGTQMGRITAKLPSDLLASLDGPTASRIQTTFRLLEHDDPEWSGRQLLQDRQVLVRQFLKVIPDYGTVILRRDKPAFEQCVQRLREAVDTFRGKLQSRLQTLIEESREKLAAVLEPAVTRHPPSRWTRCSLWGQRPAAQWLREDLQRALGTPQNYLRRMEVRCTYKGVTYELLQDRVFVQRVQAALPQVRELFREMDVVQAENIAASSVC